MKLDKAHLIEYSEHEFLEILKEFWGGDMTEAEENEFVQRFNEILVLLICYPLHFVKKSEGNLRARLSQDPRHM